MSRVEEGGRGTKTRGSITPAEDEKMMKDTTARILAERERDQKAAAEARKPWAKK